MIGGRPRFSPRLLGVDDLAAVVSAFREHYRLGDGDRQERLAAQAHDWAWEFVNDSVREKRPALLALLDALIEVPDADRAYLAYLGAGPLEDLLGEDAARWDEALAQRCRLSANWREALMGVVLDRRQQAGLRALLPYVRRSSGDEG